MQLLYLYIQEFRNIKDAEFCFSNKWHISYDKARNRVDFKERLRTMPSDFYGNQISNLNVLIGENGSGKTECLSFIRNFLTNTTTPSISIIEDTRSNPPKLLGFYHHSLEEFKIYPLTSSEYEIENISACGTGVSDPLETLLGQNVKIVYLNFGLQMRLEASPPYSIDLSTVSLLEHALISQKGTRTPTQMNAYRQQALSSIADYLNSNSYKANPFNAGERLNFVGVHFSDSNKFFSMIYDLQAKNSKFTQYIRLLTTNRDASIENGWLKTKRQLVYRILFGLAIILEKKGEIPFEIDGLSTSKLQATIKTYINKHLDKQERDFYSFIIGLPSGALITEIQLHKNDNKFIKFDFGLFQFRLNIKYAHQWLQHYFKTVERSPYLGYYWNLSSGELSFLSFFSRIYQEVESLNRVENIWLQIDESDLHLHPEWQREFLNLFLQFLNDTFHNKKIQIFLATHSPIILSDVPKQHVLFLERDKKVPGQLLENGIEEETFGGNIHQLFRYSFFLNNGFIGRFAEEKINEIIDDLNSRKHLSEKRRDEIQRTIYAIGEPIVRNKLVQLYHDKFNLDIDSRIEFLEKELKSLRKLR